MSDNNKTSASGEEYQFPGEKKTEAYTVPTDPASGGRQQMPAIQPRRMVVLVLVMITTFSIFHFVRQGKQKVKEPVVAQKMQTSKKVPEGVQPHPKLALHQTDIESIKHDLDQIEHKIRVDDSHIHQLQIATQHLEDAFAEVDDVLTNLRLGVAAINKRFQRIEDQQKQFMLKKNKKAEIKQVLPTVKYTVQATTNGRAWLQASDGDRLTVKVGDSLAGYGIVSMIDPIRGQVVMTKGAVFSYASYDS